MCLMYLYYIHIYAGAIDYMLKINICNEKKGLEELIFSLKHS